MRTLTTKATEITNFALFHEYVHNCDNKQLMGLVIEVDYANTHGHFKHGVYCDIVKDAISANDPHAVGVVTILDMCICVGQELIERVVKGTFDKNEYVSRVAAVDAAYLSDWYISSVGDESPVWTDAHINELLNDFIVIPKDTASQTYSLLISE